MIDAKESNEGIQICENDEDRLTEDIDVLKLGTLSSKRYIYNIEKESDLRNWIYMIDEKESDEIVQIGENYEDILNDDIEVLKQVNWVPRDA